MNEDKFVMHEINHVKKTIRDIREKCPEVTIPDFGVVSELNRDFYQLPKYAKSILGQKLLDELELIFEKCIKLNNKFVGLHMHELYVILNGDIEILEIRELVMNWARRYCLARVKKKNSKDKGCPFNAFYRIFHELHPSFQKLCYHENSINVLALFDFYNFIPWYLYELTWKDRVEYQISEDLRDQNTPIINFESKQKQDACISVIYNFYWHMESLFKRYYLKILIPIEDDELLSMKSKNENLNFLSNMASDLVEMKSFLIRNYKPEKSIVKIVDNIFAGWDWTVGDEIGRVYIGNSESELIECFNKQHFYFQMSMQNDGILCNTFLPWITTLTMPQNQLIIMIYINMKIVSAIHEKLYSFYEQIDVDSVLSQSLSQTSDDKLTDEFVAVTVHKLIDSETKKKEKQKKFDKQLIPKLRSQRFLNILRNKLECEVKSGKGSEITIYRKGGKKFCIGHHKRNDEIPSVLIKNILNRIKVSPYEWMEAIQ